MKAEANEMGRERTGAVIVNAGGTQRRISVRQSAADILLQPETMQISFFREGGRKTVSLKTKCS